MEQVLGAENIHTHSADRIFHAIRNEMVCSQMENGIRLKLRQLAAQPFVPDVDLKPRETPIVVRKILWITANVIVDGQHSAIRRKQRPDEVVTDKTRRARNGDSLRHQAIISL